MRNLLNESFARLRKNTTFKVCLIIVIAIPVLLISLEKILMQLPGNVSDGENAHGFNAADNCLFLLTELLPLFIAISPGFFISSDFRQNTIRNKIICGYSRTSIYMTNWITSVCITLIFHIVSTVVSMVLGSVLFAPGDIFTKENIYYSLVCIPVLISFTSITVTMSMMIRNAAGAIFSYFIHEISALFSMITMFLKSAGLEKFITLFTPYTQLQIVTYRNYYSLENMIDDIDGDIMNIVGYHIPKGFDAVALPLYAVIMIVIVTALGIWHFNKTDIK